MNETTLTTQEALDLLDRIDPKYCPMFDEHPLKVRDRVALARYFLPHHSTEGVVAPTRPRVLKWHGLGCQRSFPNDHGYYIDTYTGCSHRCAFCHAATDDPENVDGKPSFMHFLDKDMADLERFNVPPAPIYLSNNADVFQPLEHELAYAHYALAQILAHRHRFTTVTIYTKNPLLAVRCGYLGLFQKLGILPTGHPFAAELKSKERPGFQVEVTLEFWRDEARLAYAPWAPSIRERIEGIHALRNAGIPIVLRIGPLFPRSPLPTNPVLNMEDFGLPEAQTLCDLQELISLAKEVEARHVVFSLLEVVQPKSGQMPEVMGRILRLYRDLSFPGTPILRCRSWHLPTKLAKIHVIWPFLDTCVQSGVLARYGGMNPLETPFHLAYPSHFYARRPSRRAKPVGNAVVHNSCNRG